MTVLDKSSSELLSELELGARKPRKVQVRRQTAQTVDERIADAKTLKAVEAVRATCQDAHEEVLNKMRSDHIIELERAECRGYDKGSIAGRNQVTQENEDNFDDDVNSRVCDRDRPMPWSVGVVVAGEQHRILQALADWLEGFDGRINYGSGYEAATCFAKEGLSMPYFPEYTRAPHPLCAETCEPPPGQLDTGQSLNELSFTPHWRYYIRQLGDD